MELTTPDYAIASSSNAPGVVSNASTTTATTINEEISLEEILFYTLIGSIGTLLNLLVLFIALRHIDTDDKPRQILIMNMTFADLMFCLVYVVTRPFLVWFPSNTCQLYYLTIWIVQMLNVDKLLYIQFPLHYYSMVSRKKFVVLSIVTWLSLTTYSGILVGTMDYTSCINLQLNMGLYMVMCFFYLVIIVLSFAISAIIYCIAQTTTRMEHRARTKLLQRLFFLFSSTLWTFITSVPFRALYVGNILSILICFVPSANVLVGGYKSSTMRMLTDVTFKMLVGGSAVNPVITIATQRIYRARLIRYLRVVKELISAPTTPNDELSSADKRRQSSKTTIILENAPLNPLSTAL